MRTRKILVVEDEAPLRNALQEKLSREDFEVITAADGEEGLEKALKEEPDLILLDIMLPKMDGFAVTDKIRQEEKSHGIPVEKQVPIIYLTNISEEKGLSSGQQRGVYDYLIKSNWTIEGVVKKIRDKLKI